MDYKNMDTKDIIHLISNQVGETMTENNKLIIQNCCKELFEKKCDKKYVKVHYYETKLYGERYRCPTGMCQNCDCGSCEGCNILHPKVKCPCKNKMDTNTRMTICKIMDTETHQDGIFLPKHSQIGKHVITHFNRCDSYTDEDYEDTSISILKIEDI